MSQSKNSVHRLPLTADQKAWAEKHWKAAYKCAGTYGRMAAERFGWDEVFSAAADGLMVAARKYDPARSNNPSTYVYCCVRSQINRLYARARWMTCETDLFVINDNNQYPLDLLSENVTLGTWAAKNRHYEAADEAALLLAQLDAADRELIARRYGLLGHDKHTYDELAIGTPLSWQAMEQRVKKVMAKLKKLAQKTEQPAGV